jgi:hypothetical protein
MKVEKNAALREEAKADEAFITSRLHLRCARDRD